MAQLGADPDQLDQLAQVFTEESQKIEATISRITGQLGNTWWEGTDAVTFRDRWTSTHVPQLKQAVTALSEASAHCKQQASQQRETSAV